MRRCLLLLAVPAALAATPVAGAAAGVKVSRFGRGTPTLVRPGKLGVGAKGGLDAIHWSTWGPATARGVGTYDIAGFAGEPGTGFRGRVRLTFSDRGMCAGRLAYRRLTIRSSRPIGDIGHTVRITWC